MTLRAVKLHGVENIPDQLNIVREEAIAWSPSGRFLFVRALVRWRSTPSRKNKIEMVRKVSEDRLFEGIDHNTLLGKTVRKVFAEIMPKTIAETIISIPFIFNGVLDVEKSEFIPNILELGMDWGVSWLSEDIVAQEYRGNSVSQNSW